MANPTIHEEICSAINRVADALEGTNETLIEINARLDLVTFGVGTSGQLAIRTCDIGD